MSVEVNKQGVARDFDVKHSEVCYFKTGCCCREWRAYESESDPLFLEWQYDKTAVAEQTWRDKVTEIKLRYPVARGAEE